MVSMLFSSVRNCVGVSGSAMCSMGSPGDTAGMVVIPMTMPSSGQVMVSSSLPSSPVFVARGCPFWTVSPGATWKLRNPPNPALSQLELWTMVWCGEVSGRRSSVRSIMFSSAMMWVRPRRVMSWTADSTLRASPASRMMVGQPALPASLRNEPSGPGLLTMTSAPKAFASLSQSGLLMSALTFGKLVRLTAAV